MVPPKMGCHVRKNIVMLLKRVATLQLKNRTLRDTGCFVFILSCRYITSFLNNSQDLNSAPKMGCYARKNIVMLLKRVATLQLNRTLRDTGCFVFILNGRYIT